MIYAVYERTIRNRRRVMQRRSPFIMNKVIILIIDGCAPEYITPEFAPNIHRLAKQYGFVKTVKAVVPLSLIHI